MGDEGREEAALVAAMALEKPDAALLTEGDDEALCDGELVAERTLEMPFQALALAA